MIKHIFIILILLIAFCSCNRKETQKGDKGIFFEYSLTYLCNAADNPIVNILPEKMSLYYKNGKFLYYTEGWMGLFAVGQLIDTKDSTRIIMAKFLDKKYAYQQVRHEKMLDYEVFEQFSLSGKKQDTTFLNHQCQYYSLLMNETGNSTELIFAEDLDIPNPNLFLPYHFIDGMLLKFPMSTFGIPTQVQLSSYKDTTLTDALFTCSADYTMLTRKEFEEAMERYTPK